MIYFHLQKRRVHLTPEQASDFYAEHYGKMFFPSLVAYMSSGPVLAIVIARDQAISYWRELIGPTNALKARQTHPDWYVHKFESRCSLWYYAYHCHFKVREHFCWIDLSLSVQWRVKKKVIIKWLTRKHNENYWI